MLFAISSPSRLPRSPYPICFTDHSTKVDPSPLIEIVDILPNPQICCPLFLLLGIPQTPRGCARVCGWQVKRRFNPNSKLYDYQIPFTTTNSCAQQVVRRPVEIFSRFRPVLMRYDTGCSKTIDASTVWKGEWTKVERDIISNASTRVWWT